MSSHALKKHPDENTQLCHICPISRLVKLEGKALARVNAIPQLLLRKHSHPLTSSCHSNMGELHLFDSFTIYFKFLRKVASRKERSVRLYDILEIPITTLVWMWWQSENYDWATQRARLLFLCHVYAFLRLWQPSRKPVDRTKKNKT